MKETMRIFPKSVTEKLWRSHLGDYSKTLVSDVSKFKEIIPSEYHHLLYNTYLCPLCLTNYFIETKTGIIGNSEFSLDHLPPKSVGGVYKLITCKKCNNDSGIFESELEKVLNFAIDKNGDSDSIFKVNIRDEETGAIIRALSRSKNGQTDISIDENIKKYNQQYINFLDKLHNKQIKQMKIEVPLYDGKKLERALVKSAYLLCFFWWGYEFVFSNNASLIRDVIAGKMDYPCQVPIKWLEKEQILPTGVSIIQDGEKRIAFLVNIYLKGLEHSTTASILIPNPTNNGWRNLYLMGELNATNEIKTFTCTNIPRVIHRIGYTISWNLVFPNPLDKLTS